MKFADKYPNLRPIVDECNSLIRARNTGICCICGAETDYCEINYEAYFCSEECLKVMDDSYNEHLRAIPQDNTQDLFESW